VISYLFNLLVISLIFCQLLDFVCSNSFSSNLSTLWLVASPIICVLSFIQNVQKEGFIWFKKVSVNKAFPIYLAFLFILSVSGRAWVQGHLEYFIKEFLIYFILFLSGIVIWRKEDNTIEIITLFIVLFVFLESILGIVERVIWPKTFYWIQSNYYYNDGINFYHNIPRIRGSMVNPACYSIFLSVNIPLILSFLGSNQKPVIRWFSTITLITTLISILLSYSRLSYLVASITLIVSFCFSYKKNMFLFLLDKKLIIGIIILLLISILVNPTILQRGISLTNRADHSLRNRSILLTESMDMIKDYPLTGIGVGQFTSIYENYYHDSIAKVNKANTHNIYMDYWINWGIIPTLLYILLLYYFIKSTLKYLIQTEDNLKKTILAGWLGYLLIYCFIGITEDILWIPSVNIIAWVGMAIIWTICWDKKYGE
jgi:O-antigen ligase